MSPQHRLYIVEVVILYVPAILAQMHGNAVGTGLLGDDDGIHRTRVRRSSSLSHSSDVIDIHAEENRLLAHYVCLLIGVSYFSATTMQIDQNFATLEFFTIEMVRDHTAQ